MRSAAIVAVAAAALSGRASAFAPLSQPRHATELCGFNQEGSMNGEQTKIAGIGFVNGALSPISSRPQKVKGGSTPARSSPSTSAAPKKKGLGGFFNR